MDREQVFEIRDNEMLLAKNRRLHDKLVHVSAQRNLLEAVVIVQWVGLIAMFIFFAVLEKI